jgi:hypothetical protein
MPRIHPARRAPSHARDIVARYIEIACSTAPGAPSAARLHRFRVHLSRPLPGGVRARPAPLAATDYQHSHRRSRFEGLLEAVSRCQRAGHGGPDADTVRTATLVWAAMHGLASLCINRRQLSLARCRPPGRRRDGPHPRRLSGLAAVGARPRCPPPGPGTGNEVARPAASTQRIRSAPGLDIRDPQRASVGGRGRPGCCRRGYAAVIAAQPTATSRPVAPTGVNEMLWLGSWDRASS